MKLRPHHLLCTQTYIGKGYDEHFVINMTAITNRLRSEDNTNIQIVFDTDDICDKCPKKSGDGLCAENDRVMNLDKKIIDYFGIEQKPYIYQDIIKQIDIKMTADIRDDICGGCEWYYICKKN